MDNTVEERFWSKVSKGPPSSCWTWNASLTDSGYGYFSLRGKMVRAHRFAWSLVHGDPGEKWVLHRCDNRLCVNSAHLFLGDHDQNMADMNAKRRNVNQRKTHCPKGHPYEGSNLYVVQGKRYCRTCGRLHRKTYKGRTK